MQNSKADKLFQQGLDKHQAGELEAALAAYHKVLDRWPQHVDALHHLGLIATQQQDYETAIALINRALTLAPQFAEAYCSLARALFESGQREEAITVYEQAVKLKPDYAAGYANLGLTLEKVGRLDRAIAMYHRALQLDPSLAPTYSNLGNALRTQGNLQDALKYAQQAVLIQPDFSEGHINHGNTLQAIGCFTEAAECYVKATELASDNCEAWCNLGNVHQSLGKLDQAVTAYEKALEINLTYTDACSNLILCLQYHPDYTEAQLLDMTHRWTVAAQLAPVTALISYHDNVRSSHLRVGFVSADFYKHPVGWFLKPMLRALTGTQLEVFCYANQVIEDAVTQECRDNAKHWRSIYGWSDDRVYAKIQEDRIDVLVDLSGHTSGNRLRVFAMRAAPVQLSWLGYFATTGLKEMDYVLMDEVHIPPGSEALFSERVLRLEGGRFCYEPPEYAPPVSPPPCDAGNGICFGSFNSTAKLNDEVIQVWARIITKTRNSRLLLKCKTFSDEEYQREIRGRFSKYGVDAERLELRGQSTHEQMLAEYEDIDIALDPFPFSGALTTCEALWMGVPVVSMPGIRPVSRQGLAILKTIGLEKFTATDTQTYIETACELAAAPDRLRELRTGMRDRMRASPLFDYINAARNLEDCFQKVHQAMQN